MGQSVFLASGYLVELLGSRYLGNTCVVAYANTTSPCPSSNRNTTVIGDLRRVWRAVTFVFVFVFGTAMYECQPKRAKRHDGKRTRDHVEVPFAQKLGGHPSLFANAVVSPLATWEEK